MTKNKNSRVGFKHRKEIKMAYKKNYKRRGNGKKYSSEEKYRYHSSRNTACGRYGLKYGGPKHSYSSGFADGFHFIDNTSATTSEFGKRSGKAYSIGNKRGQAAAIEYSKRTGHNPRSLYS